MADAGVADASPLIFLARIRHLDWMRQVGPTVVVPRAVLDELDAGSRRDDVGALVRRMGFFAIVEDLPVPPQVAVWQMGAGESQVLTHALAHPGRAALLDDRAARRCAASLGVTAVGTVGLVALVKQRGLIDVAEPVLTSLRRHGLRLSDAIVARVLRELGEAE